MCETGEDGEGGPELYDGEVQEGMWYELMADPDVETPPPPETGDE